MADTHTLQEIIEKTIQTTLLKAHPVGSYWLTESDDDPNTLFGGVWERVKGKLLQCSDDTHPAGIDIEAGLPNITGTFAVRPASTIDSSAAFSGTAFTEAVCGLYERVDTPFYGSFGTVAFSMDASRSSAIYGKSDTVQPETHVVNVWKRIS